mgnify:CR=1 FL=1
MKYTAKPKSWNPHTRSNRAARWLDTSMDMGISLDKEPEYKGKVLRRRGLSITEVRKEVK